MFQFTQSLTFRTIASLRHFKIHHQLPLTPRESTQLLNLLTTSFRRQLDREHGAVGSARDANDMALASLPSGKLVQGKQQKHSQSRPDVRTPADRHVHSILTNPLFRDVEKGSGKKGQQLRDPMDIFDEACAKGFMKIEYAAACLKATKQKIIRSSILSVREGMRLSGAGSKTLKWMLSSGVADDKSFVKDRAFSELLVEFLVVEGQEMVIWTWLETLVCDISSLSPKGPPILSIRNTRDLLYYLVKAQTSGSASLDVAFSSLAKAEKMLAGLEHISRSVLRGAGTHLYSEIVAQRVSPSKSSSDMFELFLSIAPRSLSLGYEITLPSLLLYHPTKPDAKPALKFLEKVKKIASAASDPETRNMVFRARRFADRHIIYLGLATARFLFERNQQTEAHWVMNFLEETYGKLLGLSQKELFSLRNQVHAESSSLELLNSLNLV
jgi:hypothetical protein